ncbi:hypothetical protein BZA05DRAFT_82465 [Tricharina praecox]|uniref:uncharacterized protein n=1 Tax=Tricharina praecox TaxID=43433 RepID=UPI00221F6BE1|nr:uncharacterized protein BZA05DRAFT_82465 [Tricharina praecox]KAI5849085.1 hypothetical protein BZA05DRAFT_82465 [Tricharina praecox]
MALNRGFCLFLLSFLFTPFPFYLWLSSIFLAISVLCFWLVGRGWGNWRRVGFFFRMHAFNGYRVASIIRIVLLFIIYFFVFYFIFFCPERCSFFSSPRIRLFCFFAFCFRSLVGLGIFPFFFPCSCFLFCIARLRAAACLLS